ncbi:MAG TPA: response regulator [Spirochaetota bacterium]
MPRDAIICVDDEAIILLSLKQEIKDYFGDRFVYETAMNGEEALEVVAELDAEGTRTVVIISDWLMPRMKGDELILEAKRRYPWMKGILITGQADRNSIERARSETDIVGCINKPWRREELMSAIEKAVAE